MSALYTYSLRTDAELQRLMDGFQVSLEELAPYNGTTAGAAAIAETQRQRDLVQREIDRRAK